MYAYWQEWVIGFVYESHAGLPQLSWHIGRKTNLLLLMLPHSGDSQ